MKTPIELIQEERQRQITAEGYTAEHDDRHTHGEIATAAGCYAHTAGMQEKHGMIQTPPCFVHKAWPWERDAFKGNNPPLTNLVKAGAMICAEIERIQRREARAKN